MLTIEDLNRIINIPSISLDINQGRVKDVIDFRDEVIPFVDNLNIFTVDFSVNTAEQLFLIAEKMQAEGKEPLNDYDGPVYLRASEAEVKHNS